MTFKNRGYTVASIVVLIVVLLFGHADAGSLIVVEKVSPLPETQELRLVGLLPLAIGGIMAVYDDAATKRPLDYAEIYNPSGELLAIFWFDRFGILRTAVDRSIVLKRDAVEGVLVLVLDGDLV